MTVEQPTNRVLAALSPMQLRRCTPYLERVELQAGRVLLETQDSATCMFFPEGALVGLTHTSGPGSAEVPVALVGHDGVLGAASLLNATDQRLRATVLHSGRGWRLSVAVLRSDPIAVKSLLPVVLRYLQALNLQMSQAALCRLQHTPHQRLGRWLLDAFARVSDTTLQVEAATLSAWLGTAPDAVARASAQWVTTGAITQGERSFTLRDRAQLARLACRCHQQVQQQIDPLFTPSA